ncbi:AsmA family protein [Geoalkalibacter halelectricus]|uniref:AsmA family protein n=1 Tax=Geoalkalibacter halelectricus TaxID=2847045 RepID=A0ABY5ZGW6_9BACT|nr:AsmA family protein [Geoalkalibacter halelectricus]MDO3376637.1 AsmA family protein [Geoalkalibacter halelectricus]UWZ78405.1 AsmA family protein [Geoalkalibacter halelectricus]
MSKPLKFSLIFAAGVLALLVLLALVMRHFVSADAVRPRLEAVVSETLGLDLRVEGPMRFTIFSPLVLTLEDAHLDDEDAEIASVKKARVAVALGPLLQGKIRIKEVVLVQPQIAFERDQEGKFPFTDPRDAQEHQPALTLAKLTVSEGSLIFTDKKLGQTLEAVDCNLNLRDLHLPAVENSSDPRRYPSFTADLACAEFRHDDFGVADLSGALVADGATLDITEFTVQAFGSQGTGSLQGDFTGAVPRFQAEFSLPQFDVDRFFQTLASEQVAEGRMDFSATLSAQGDTRDALRRSLEGQISLRGTDLTLHGTDLDREFAQFEAVQSFNLVDLGALFFVGPFGMVVTKGYEFASIFYRTEGSTAIRTLVSEWEVEEGVTRAKDVAMATSQYRVALQGGVDLAHERFDDLTVALVDAEGCAIVEQKIVGTFDEPEMRKPHFLTTLARPALELLKRGLTLFPGVECEVFYDGSVAAPN